MSDPRVEAMAAAIDVERGEPTPNPLSRIAAAGLLAALDAGPLLVVDRERPVEAVAKAMHRVIGDRHTEHHWNGCDMQREYRAEARAIVEGVRG